MVLHKNRGALPYQYQLYSNVAEETTKTNCKQMSCKMCVEQKDTEAETCKATKENINMEFF